MMDVIPIESVSTADFYKRALWLQVLEIRRLLEIESVSLVSKRDSERNRKAIAEIDHHDAEGKLHQMVDDVIESLGEEAAKSELGAFGLMLFRQIRDLEDECIRRAASRSRRKRR